MFSPSGIVTLLTDFGTRDSYVGQMKGVMLALDRTLTIVDLTHEIPPQDVLEGAFQLATAMQAFPAGTVHLAVVDPGVGTQRRAVALLDAGRIFVGPDNGLFSLAIADAPERAVTLSNAMLHQPQVAPTFHGRDIFAPVAACLAGGRVGLEDVGESVEPGALIGLDLEPVVYEEHGARGAIVSIDRFGNCLTMIDPERLEYLGPLVSIQCQGFRATGISHTYGDQPEGRPVALAGSHGGLELAVRDGSAAERFGLRRGDLVNMSG